MLDDMLLQLATLREQPAWQPMPGRVQSALTGGQPPQEGAAIAKVYREFVTNIAPYGTGNRHPRAWGWVRGTGTPVAMLAEMLAAGLNSHVGSGHSAPVLVEEQVLGWLAGVMGMPAGTSGLLTSGATMANLLGLAVARHAQAGFDVRKCGLSEQPRMGVYCSRETHFWAPKTLELLGMGRDSLREIAVDSEYRIDVGALERQVEADRRSGLLPIAVIANAGTVNTGAIDDLHALRRVCDRQGLWLHIDGAFAAMLKLTKVYAPLVGGLELADSLAFDLHKWMYLPFEIGCLFVRNAEQHTAAFATAAPYLEQETRGLLSGDLSFIDRGMEGSRNFKALKVWMSIKTHGLKELGEAVEQNMEQAAYFAGLVEAHPELALLAPCTTNVVCFAYVPVEGATEISQANSLQREIMLRMQEAGEFILAGTTLNCADRKRFAMRIAITNHRSRREDFAALAEAVVRTGRCILAELLQGAAEGAQARSHPRG